MIRRVMRWLAGFGRLPFQPTLRWWHRRSLRRTLARDEARQAMAARGRSAWSHDDHWYGRGAEPRAHNQLTPLIDGEAYFGRLVDAISNAQHSVYIAGWCCTAQFPLKRGSTEEMVSTRLVELLAATAERVPVRVLLWTGSPGLYPPTDSYVQEVQRQFEEMRRPNLVCRLDATLSGYSSHHQKIVIVDGRLAFVGGIDITLLDGDRWDTRDHELRSGPAWHDLAVLLEGEAVKDVGANFASRWFAVTGEELVISASGGSEQITAEVQVVRTLPDGTYPGVEDEFGVYHSLLTMLRAARRYVYLEGPYLWSSAVIETLEELIAHPPSSQFRVVLLLPAFGFPGQSTNDSAVQRLRDASADSGVFEAFSVYTSGPAPGERPIRYRSIYVHSKLCIVDDEWSLVGSANMNDRSFATDSELCLVVHDSAFASKLRTELWGEHLGISVEEVASRDVTALVDQEWCVRASTNVAAMTGDAVLTSCVVAYGSDIRGDSIILEALVIGAPGL